MQHINAIFFVLAKIFTLMLFTTSASVKNLTRLEITCF